VLDFGANAFGQAPKVNGHCETIGEKGYTVANLRQDGGMNIQLEVREEEKKAGSAFDPRGEVSSLNEGAP
jgi:hypothetical protein